MASFENEKLGARFSVSDRITVRQQLAYLGARQFSDASEAFERSWRAALPLIEGWECALIPDPQALNLDEASDPRVTSVILWAAGKVAAHVAELDRVPKA